MTQPLPDTQTAETWLREQGATEELLAHVRLVATVAEHLAERLAAAGEAVDPTLAQRGGLLHDLAKISAKDAARSHEVMAAELLRGKGQDALAEIALRHAVWAPASEDQRPQTWEQRVVYYADRIASHGRVVSIAERIADMRQRRPELRERLPIYEAAALAQQEQIAQRLGVSADELLRELRDATGQ